jgi:hypothetical protein
MSDVFVRADFPPAGGRRRPVGPAGTGPGKVIEATDRFRRVRRLGRRGYAILSFVVLCPLLLFAPDSSLRIVDSLAGSRSVVTRQRQP